jgi:hypothetical protein
LATLGSAFVAAAHLAPFPAEVDSGAAATEEKVIIEFVLLRGWTSAFEYPFRSGSFDGENDSGIIIVYEDVASKAIRVWFKSERLMLMTVGLSRMHK